MKNPLSRKHLEMKRREFDVIGGAATVQINVNLNNCSHSETGGSANRDVFLNTQL